MTTPARIRATCSDCLDAPEGHKHCHGECDLIKPLDAFHNDARSKDGKTGRCMECNNTKATAQYWTDRDGRRASNDQWYADHPTAQADRKRKAREIDPEQWDNKRLLQFYHITLQEYLDMLEFQGGHCAVCPSISGNKDGTGRFHVDHDHNCCPGYGSCGLCVRGLLCNYCNTRVLPVAENPVILASAQTYLDRYAYTRTMRCSASVGPISPEGTSL